MVSQNSTTLDVDLVFGDLEDVYKEFKDQKSSPKTTRRTFTQFVELSQKLTSMMRKEYEQETGKNWAANNFPGWDNITKFFKYLRNADQHEYSIRIQLVDTYKISESDIFEDPTIDPNSRFLVIQGKWGFGDDYDDEFPEPVKFSQADVETGEPSDWEIGTTHREIYYSLIPKTKKISDLLVEAGTDDIHILCDHCFLILSDYFKYYKNSLDLTRQRV